MLAKTSHVKKRKHTCFSLFLIWKVFVCFYCFGARKQLIVFIFSTVLFVRFYLLWAEKTNKKNVRKYLAYDLQWHRWFEKRNRFSFLALFSFVEDFRSLSVDRVFVSVGMTMLTSGLLTYYETNRCNSDAFCTMSVRSFLFCPLFVRRRMVFDCPAVCGCPSFTCWA